MTQRLPLEGIRVLDFGWVMAAPITAQLMADMGAQVIKVESRTHLDAARRGRPLISNDSSAGDLGEDPDGVPLFHNLNRGKLSLTIDLTHPSAWQVIAPLVSVSDVVVHNLTPRACTKLGLTYEVMSSHKSNIIVISLTAAGQYGPLSDISAYAPGVSSLAGLEGLVGYEGEEPIGMLGLNFSDPNAGMLGYLAAVSALLHRGRTGQGQHIDLSQMEGVAQYLGEPFMDFVMNGRVSSPKGNHHPRMAPYGNYATVERDRWIAIAVGTDAEWEAFAEVVNEGWTQDKRFTTRENRLKNRIPLNQCVANWVASKSEVTILTPLQNAGVAAMPVMSIEDQFSDPQHQARGVYVDVDHPKVGSEPIYGLTWKMTRTPGRVGYSAPLLGEHNGHILQHILHFTPEQIANFENNGLLK